MKTYTVKLTLKELIHTQAAIATLQRRIEGGGIDSRAKAAQLEPIRQQLFDLISKAERKEGIRQLREWKADLRALANLAERLGATCKPNPAQFIITTIRAINGTNGTIYDSQPTEAFQTIQAYLSGHDLWADALAELLDRFKGSSALRAIAAEAYRHTRTGNPIDDAMADIAANPTENDRAKDAAAAVAADLDKIADAIAEMEPEA